MGQGLGPHAAFILLAYAAAAIIVGGLVAWIVVDARAQRRAIAELESRGVTRRSTRTPARDAEPAT